MAIVGMSWYVRYADFANVPVSTAREVMTTLCIVPPIMPFVTAHFSVRITRYPCVSVNYAS